ncbi:MAG: glycosyltransferase family 2 protein [Sphingomonadaceae bacterium]|nr:glycosyltransferase family 2 protein [Sphingomonadaceae bacterium]
MAGLRLRVHVDGFASAPLAYLTAAKWWILGKRVRARGQLAPLLGRSRHAYSLWAMTEVEEGPAGDTGSIEPPILALVLSPGGADSALAKASLASLARDGLEALVVPPVLRPDDIASVTSSMDRSRSPWIMILTEGDLLRPGAVAKDRAAIEEEVAVLYADDDLVARGGRIKDPHFKPGWNSELFHHCDYLTGASIMRARKEWFEEVAGTDDWPQALIWRAVGSGRVQQVPHVLHHRRARPAMAPSVASLVPAAQLPKVSVIVPTRNGLGLLRTCVEGLERTDYPDMEVIVVDNDSDDPETLAYLAALPAERYTVLHHAGAFNYSAINNRAVERATGTLLCLLNNDIEVISPDWLKIMATQAQRDEVGAVGAQLLYPDGRIQHAGVVIGVGNAAGHAHRFLAPSAQGYFRRHALPQFTSAVTAACLVVARDKFLAVGGLDEKHFAVAFNDVDLCLRLNQRGWQSLYEPRACLIHHESVSRGFDRDPVGAKRFAGELAALQERWKTNEIVDPFHHPRLSRAAEQFTIAL